MNPLQKRLSALRRRLRQTIVFRGFSWTIVILLLAAATAGALDWRVHLPVLVRVSVLTFTLTGAGYLAYRLLLGPLAARSDDLTLALRVEARHPELNDSLASAVQFLEHSDEDPGSPALRQAAIKRALGVVRRYDFGSVADTSGLP